MFASKRVHELTAAGVLLCVLVLGIVGGLASTLTFSLIGPSGVLPDAFRLGSSETALAVPLRILMQGAGLFLILALALFGGLLALFVLRQLATPFGVRLTKADRSNAA